MDNTTRLYWEKVADRCFDRAYKKVLNSVTSASHCDKSKKHLEPEEKLISMNPEN